MAKETKSPPWHRFQKVALKPVDKRARNLERASLKHAHKFVFKRISNLRLIRRHVLAWLFLVGMLIVLALVQIFINLRTVSSEQPQRGGTYAEGVVGTVTTLNPLFAASQAELSADKLIFASLVTYDQAGYLQNSLAQSVELSEKGKKYTVTLRPDLVWHDGAKLTASDVVFTVKTMQNPRIGATSLKSWRGVKVSAVSENRIVFELPNSYAPFMSILNFSVLPEHILAKVNPEKMQESDFGKHPVGSGPFRYLTTQTLDAASSRVAVQLGSFEKYWAGAPSVNRFYLYTYADEKTLTAGLRSHEISAAGDVSVSEIRSLEENNMIIHNTPLNSGVYALLNVNSTVLKDIDVRQALVRATNRMPISTEQQGSALDGPIINTRLPQTGLVRQANFSVKDANALFDKAGWVKTGNEGIRKKAAVPLEIRVVSIDTPGYHAVVEQLKTQWAKLGVRVNTQFVDPEQIQQSVLTARDYDVLVYELEVGGDPDVFAYWHSSQANAAGLNLSNYSSKLADDALVSGRIRGSWPVRDSKYASFAKQWVADAPAIALYRPSYHYATVRGVKSITDQTVFPSAIDRFSTVTDWTVQSSLQFTSP